MKFNVKNYFITLPYLIIAAFALQNLALPSLLYYGLLLVIGIALNFIADIVA